MNYSLALLITLSAGMIATPDQDTALPQMLDAPGILLTFDDTYITEWVQAIPLFQKYDAHATFFVTRFDQLTPEQLEGLRKLRAAGHAIGCHGLRHRKAAEFTAENDMETYMALEILPALRHMEKTGFTPVSFAYPSSNNNDQTDEALLKTFRHLRTGIAPKEGQRYAQMDDLFTPLDSMAERGCLPGKGIDRIGEPDREILFEQLLEAMDRAADKRECLTLYAHNIATSGRLHLKPATLEKILKHGQQRGLRFYSFDELP